MPLEAFGPNHPFLNDSRLMKGDEIVRIAKAFLGLGVEKIRLTGGEPLLRSDLPSIVRSLKRGLGAPELSMTTNGWFLSRQAAALRESGLDRLNVSVDALDPVIAGRMNGLGFSIARILEGIDAAAGLGFPIKVNCVVQRGVNDGEILPLCTYFRARGITLRFIEYMDVGNTNAWAQAQVLPAGEILARIASEWPIEPVGPAYRGEVAARYRYLDGAGEIGIVSSVTQPFCRDCTRARLSADGKLFTCLFASKGADVLGLVRSGASDDDLRRFIEGVWLGRGDRYSDERAGILERGPAPSKIEMSYIGG
jgi:cyclic pyranopterin phosphate synthase